MWKYENERKNHFERAHKINALQSYEQPAEYSTFRSRLSAGGGYRSLSCL
jgi:hypothetical protein